jgi:hypothetical protein
MRFNKVEFLPVLLLWVSVSLANSKPSFAGNEIMKDRCSGQVSFPSSYNQGPEQGYILSRGSDGWSPWTSSFRVGLGDSGRIRWWCRSTTGNMFDPGTWRIQELQFGTICNENRRADGSYDCRPDARVKLGSSAWNGWTAERSRCNNRSSVIRARLGPNRLLLIECQGR